MHVLFENSSKEDHGNSLIQGYVFMDARMVDPYRCDHWLLS